MGALKKMTRCGSISALFAVLIVLFGVSSSALTTFGKSNTNQQGPPPTRPPASSSQIQGKFNFTEYDGFVNEKDLMTFQNISEEDDGLFVRFLLESVFADGFGVKAKECTSHADCATIQNTSCVQAADDRMRCLCGDSEAPSNGYCQAKFKGLRHLCTDTMQCDIGMMCAVENVTKTTTLVTSKTFMTSNMLNNNTSNYKVCLCDKELGFIEDKLDIGHCSGAITLALNGTLISLLALLLGSTIASKSFNYWVPGM